MMKVAVLVSGRGSNLRSLTQAMQRGSCPVTLTQVLSDRSSALALDFASQAGLPSTVVSFRKDQDRAEWDRAVADSIAASGAELVVLAGFMRLLGPAVLDRFRHRIVNVHPSLLPAFPGMHGPRDAIQAGVKISGCTVHLVDDGMDTGPILAQAAVPVLPDDTEATLHARIQKAEHRLLPEVVRWIASGELVLGAVPRVSPALLREPQEDAVFWVPIPGTTR